MYFFVLLNFEFFLNSARSKSRTCPYTLRSSQRTGFEKSANVIWNGMKNRGFSGLPAENPEIFGKHSKERNAIEIQFPATAKHFLRSDRRHRIRPVFATRVASHSDGAATPLRKRARAFAGNPRPDREGHKPLLRGARGPLRHELPGDARAGVPAAGIEPRLRPARRPRHQPQENTGTARLLRNRPEKVRAIHDKRQRQSSQDRNDRPE